MPHAREPPIARRATPDQATPCNPNVLSQLQRRLSAEAWLACSPGTGCGPLSPAGAARDATPATCATRDAQSRRLGCDLQSPSLNMPRTGSFSLTVPTCRISSILARHVHCPCCCCCYHPQPPLSADVQNLSHLLLSNTTSVGHVAYLARLPFVKSNRMTEHEHTVSR